MARSLQATLVGFDKWKNQQNQTNKQKGQQVLWGVNGVDLGEDWEWGGGEYVQNTMHAILNELTNKKELE